MEHESRQHGLPAAAEEEGQEEAWDEGAQGVSALVPRSRRWTMGAPDAPVVQGRVVRQTFTVYAPVLSSPTNLNKQVDAVVERIGKGSWEVTSYSVRSGDQFKAIPLLPKFLQPTVQIMKFVVRRRDAAQTSREAAMSVVMAAAIQQGLTLQSFKDWVVEIKEEIVEPSVPTLPRVAGATCAAIRAATGLPCWVVVGGVALVAFGAAALVAYPYVAPFLTSRRAFGAAPEDRRLRRPKRVRDSAGEASTTANDPRQARRIAEGRDPLPDRYVRGWAKQKRKGSNQRSLIGAAGRACAGTGPIGGARRSACLRDYIREHS